MGTVDFNGAPLGLQVQQCEQPFLEERNRLSALRIFLRLKIKMSLRLRPSISMLLSVSAHTLVFNPFNLDSTAGILSSTSDPQFSASVMRFVLDSSRVVILSSVAVSSPNFFSIIVDILSATYCDISIARARAGVALPH